MSIATELKGLQWLEAIIPLMKILINIRSVDRQWSDGLEEEEIAQHKSHITTSGGWYGEWEGHELCAVGVAISPS